MDRCPCRRGAGRARLRRLQVRQRRGPPARRAGPTASSSPRTRRSTSTTRSLATRATARSCSRAPRTPRPSTSGSPTASRGRSTSWSTPTPTPRASRRSAPLVFSLTGNVAVGQRSERTSRGDLSSGTLANFLDNVQTTNAGLLAHVERRTSNSSFEVSVPAGFAVNQTTLGALEAGYYTPRFGFVYGAQPLSFFSFQALFQVPRSSSLTLCSRANAPDVAPTFIVLDMPHDLLFGQAGGLHELSSGLICVFV